jgi:hypothetical protein
MALRLQYDEVPIDNVEPNIGQAFKRFMTTNEKQPKRIYCTYTAMLAIRRKIGRIVNVEPIG